MERSGIGSEQFGTFFEDIYKATRDEDEKLRGAGHCCGFKILNGPPVYQTPVLFLGYQPGGCEKAAKDHKAAEFTWPPQLEFRLDSCETYWEQIATLVKDEDKLQQCMGMNAIFFRAKGVKEWSRVKVSVRKEAEAFSLKCAEKIVRELRPKVILVSGYMTMTRLLRSLGPSKMTRVDWTGQIIRPFMLWDTPAFAIPHLSGYRFKAGARASLYEDVRSRLKEEHVWD